MNPECPLKNVELHLLVLTMKQLAPLVVLPAPLVFKQSSRVKIRRKRLLAALISGILLTKNFVLTFVQRST